MINHLFEFGLLCLTSLFTMINPFSITPVFISLTSDLAPEYTRHVALKSTATAAVILVVFACIGSFIFDVFSISADSMRVVGGILFFLNGYDMVQARVSRSKMDNLQNHQNMDEYTNDLAITPLAIPLICGPGAIATVIILMHQGQNILEKGMLFIIMLLICSVVYVFLLFAKPITNALGESGNKVLMRIMGLIVMVIGVQFLFNGLTPILRDIFVK